jgi:hypothetical protein
VSAAARPTPVPQASLLVDRVVEELSAAPDFVDGVAANVTLVVEALVMFLSARLDAPRAYMREDGKGEDALEAELQADLLEWLRGGALLQGITVLEPQHVGGGRADIMIVMDGQRIVIEVKREKGSSEREALHDSYSRQAGSYDATDYPFGLVAVLDISDLPPMTPRLVDCVWVHTFGPEGTSKRRLVFVRVPGRLRTPSSQTGRLE